MRMAVVRSRFQQPAPARTNNPLCLLRAMAAAPAPTNFGDFTPGEGSVVATPGEGSAAPVVEKQAAPEAGAAGEEEAVPVVHLTDWSK